MNKVLLAKQYIIIYFISRIASVRAMGDTKIIKIEDIINLNIHIADSIAQMRHETCFVRLCCIALKKHALRDEGRNAIKAVWCILFGPVMAHWASLVLGNKTTSLKRVDHKYNYVCMHMIITQKPVGFDYNFRYFTCWRVVLCVLYVLTTSTGCPTKMYHICFAHRSFNFEDILET